MRRQTYAVISRAIRERLASGVLELPLLPDTVREVVVAVSDPNSDARAIAELVRSDPAMASHVLRISNSALYSPSAPIVSLQHAVARLGMGTLRDILLLVSCSVRTVRGREPEVRADFRHAVTSAAFAREIGRLLRTNVESAFLAGLLHDVGRPVVRDAVLQVARELGAACDPTEEDTLVDDLHPEVGAALVRLWKLPPELEDVARHHHDASPKSPLVALAAVADVLAVIARQPRTTSMQAVEERLARAPALGLIGLYPEDVVDLVARRDAIIGGADA